MKKTNLFLLPCLSLLASFALHGQNTPVLNNDDQSSSPLMMFSGDEEIPTEGATDLRNITSRGNERSGAGGGSSSQAVRGAAVAVSEEDTTNTYLENEICNNIYTACLVRVADMSLGKIPLIGGSSVEASARAEWEAAKEMAAEEEEEFKNEWERAKRETLAAQQKLDSANARLHGQLYADEAYYTFQVKELSEQLAEARVKTARATLNAIKFKDTVQRAKAEAKLNEAILLESKASDALKEATSNSSPTKLAQLLTASPLIIRHVEAMGEIPEITYPTVRGKSAAEVCNEKNFLDEHTLPTLALPQPPAPSALAGDKKILAARKKIEAAEAALENAEAAHDVAKKVIKRSGKVDTETEKGAYEAAEEAWTDAIVAYEGAIEKATAAKLDPTEIEELNDNLKTTEENAAYWTDYIQAHSKKLAQSVTQAAAEELHDTDIGGKEPIAAQAAIVEEQLPLPAIPKAVAEASIQIEVQATTELQTQIEELKRLSSESKVRADASSNAEKMRWKNSSDSFNESTEYLNNAINSKSSGYRESEFFWSEAASCAKESAEQSKLSAQAYASKNLKEGGQFNNSAGSLLVQARNAKYKAKAKEAEAAGKSAEAQNWRAAAALNQQSIEPYTQAARAYAAKEIEEGNSWDNAGNGFTQAAEKLGEAIEAETAGKSAIAQKWRDAVALNQQSIEPFTQAARACKLQSAYAYRNENIYLNMAGNGFTQAAEKLGKAIKAEVAEKPAEAQKWSEAATLQRRSIHCFTQASPYVRRRPCVGESLFNAGKGFYNAAEQLGNAIDAEAAGKSAIAQKWRDAAVLNQQSVELYNQAIRAYEGTADIKLFEEAYISNPNAANKMNEGTSWDNAGDGFRYAAEKLGKAIDKEVAGKSVEAQKYRDAAVQYQRSSESFTAAARAYEGATWLNGGKKKGERFDAEGRTIKQEAVRLVRLAEGW